MPEGAEADSDSGDAIGQAVDVFVATVAFYSNAALMCSKVSV